MAIYQSNLVFGNLIVFVLLYFNINIYFIFVCLFFVALTGDVLSFFLHPYSIGNEEIIKEEIIEEETEKPKGISSKEQQNQAKNEEEMQDYDTFQGTNPFAAQNSAKIPKKIIKKLTISQKIAGIPLKFVKKLKNTLKETKDSLISTFLFLFSRKSLLIAPTMLHTGFANTFYTGTLPQITKNAQWISLSYILFGTFGCLASIIVGKANDVVGRRTMLYISYFLHGLAIISSLDPIFFFTGRTRTIFDQKTGNQIVISEGQFLDH